MDTQAPLILVCEDEADIQELIGYNLEQEGFRTAHVVRGDKVIEAVKSNRPDLILLDLMMPGMSGTEVCKKLRQDDATRVIPVIMVTAKASEIDKVVGLEIGADDYITKPFSPKELVARVKAVLRRSQPKASVPASNEMIKGRDLSVDLKAHRVFLKKRELHLTLTEFKLLKELLVASGQVLSRENLKDSVAGSDVSITPRTIDVHMAALRKKLESAGEYIETVRGVGYRFRND